MPRRAFRAAALLVATLAASTFAADTLHVIELRHRPAAELQPLLQPLLRVDEGLSASGYRLILRATEARRAEIERLVAQLDVAAPQLLITVRHIRSRDAARARDEVSGAIEIGGRGRVIVPERPSSGDSSDAGGRRDGLRYRFERRTATAESGHTQTLRVRDGSRAFIRAGQSVPVVERVLALTGRRRAVVASGVRFEEFTTGFDVLPRVRGEIAHLEVTPRLSGPARAGASVRFQELSTTVSVRLGEWIDLGAVSGRASEVNRAILQSARRETGEQATILLKVERQ